MNSMTNTVMPVISTTIGERLCAHCNQNKSLNEFYKKKVRGRVVSSYTCKACHRVNMAAKYRNSEAYKNGCKIANIKNLFQNITPAEKLKLMEYIELKVPSAVIAEKFNKPTESIRKFIGCKYHQTRL